MRFPNLCAPMVASGLSAIVLAMLVPVQAWAEDSASPARGKILFLRCASCHAINADAAAKIGPNLSGVVGRKSGSLDGYHYSSAMAAKGLVWTEENLDLWLTAPAKVVPGTSMAFAGIADPASRKALIAYLKKPS